MDNFELSIGGREFCASPIYCAIQGGHQDRLLSAIHQGEDVAAFDPEFKSTYLHILVSVANLATEDVYVPMVYQLSNAGVDVNATDYKGQTALKMAIHAELQDIMVALIRVGVDPTEQDYRKIILSNNSPFESSMLDTFEKYQPGLWAAVRANDVGMVHMLLNSWCRVYIQVQGRTLMQYALETQRSTEILQLLDDFLVTLEFVHATLAGDEKRMLEFLMDSKPCDPYIMDISYQENWSQPLSPRSLRDAAIAMGHTHVLHLLPEGPDDCRSVTDPSQQCRATLLPMLSYTGDLGEEDPFQAGDGEYSTFTSSDAQSGKCNRLSFEYESSEHMLKDAGLQQNHVVKSIGFGNNDSSTYESKVKPCNLLENPNSRNEPEAAIEGCDFSDSPTYLCPPLPMGSVRGYKVLNYTRNWERVPGKSPKSKASKPKSKLCVIS